MGADDGQPDGALSNLSVPTPKIDSGSSSGEPVQAATPTLDKAAIDKLVEERVKAGIREFEERLEPELDKKVQSRTDRRFSALGNLSAKDLKTVSDLLEKHKGDVDAAGDELALKAWREERQSKTPEPAQVEKPASSSTEVPGRTKVERDAEIIKALEPFKLTREKNQAVLDEWGKKEFHSDAEALVGLNSIIAKASQPVPAPSPAGIVAPAAGIVSPVGDTDKAASVGQLADSLNLLYKSPSKNALEIAKTKLQLSELGATEFVLSDNEQKMLKVGPYKLP